MSLVNNERTKLLVNALDRASTACFTVGVATPLAAILYNLGGFRTAFDPRTLAFCLGGWLLASVALHYIARTMLGRLVS